MVTFGGIRQAHHNDFDVRDASGVGVQSVHVHDFNFDIWNRLPDPRDPLGDFLVCRPMGRAAARDKQFR
jgi:hypothetical protein